MIKGALYNFFSTKQYRYTKGRAVTTITEFVMGRSGNSLFLGNEKTQSPTGEAKRRSSISQAEAHIEHRIKY